MPILTGQPVAVQATGHGAMATGDDPAAVEAAVDAAAEGVRFAAALLYIVLSRVMQRKEVRA